MHLPFQFILENRGVRDMEALPESFPVVRSCFIGQEFPNQGERLTAHFFSTDVLAAPPLDLRVNDVSDLHSKRSRDDLIYFGKIDSCDGGGQSFIRLFCRHCKVIRKQIRPHEVFDETRPPFPELFWRRACKTAEELPS